MASRDTTWRLLFPLFLLLSTSKALTPRQRGQGYQITPKACSVNTVDGVCMFVWECIRHEGEHLGMCMDAFMFGSCCLLPNNVTVPTVAADTSPAGSSVVSTYFNQQQQYATRPPHVNSINNKPASKRPPHRSTSTTTPRSSTQPYTKYSTSSFRPITTETYETSASELFVSSKPSPADSSTTAAEAKVPSTTSLWLSSTEEPAFVTRPKPTTALWSTSFRPRPPDQSQGNINAQRPMTKPPGSFITKKPTRPTTINDFITTTKHPGKPNTPDDYVTMKYPTKPPQFTVVSTILPPKPTERPAIADFLTLPPKPPTVVHLVRPNTQTTGLTTLATPSTTSMIPPTKPIITTSSTSVKPPHQLPAQPRLECGVPPLFPRPEMRIVGGKSSEFGKWPWQASVRRTSFFGFSSTHRCGGALLNDQWVATAGHCVDDLLTSQIRIRVGEYDFSSAGEAMPHEERGVIKKVVHPRYNFFTYEYDLALVQLDKPLQFAAHIAPICLPASDDLLVGETATVTGWGRLSEGGTLPSVLQEVSVPIVSNEKCKSMFLRAGRHEHIPEIFLCAGYDDGGRDSCQGDSGGPLQVRGKDGRYFLAGIISWGIGCAESNLPGVCTRISKFVPWIMENVT